jgi:hypothetical protein
MRLTRSERRRTAAQDLDRDLIAHRLLVQIHLELPAVLHHLAVERGDHVAGFSPARSAGPPG